MEKKEFDYIPTQKELIEWITNRRKYSKTDRDQALISCLYLTGARINEVLNKLTPSQFEKQKSNKNNYLFVNGIFTEKLKKTKTKRRSQLIPISRPEEKKIWYFLSYYIDKKESKEPIFKITPSMAYRIVNEWLSKFKEQSPKGESHEKKVSFLDGCHYLRHVRNTHLVQIYDFNLYELKKWNNWQSNDTASNYIHLKVSDFKRRFEN